MSFGSCTGARCHMVYVCVSEQVIQSVSVIGNHVVDEAALNKSLAKLNKTITDPFTFEEFRLLVDDVSDSRE